MSEENAEYGVSNSPKRKRNNQIVIRANDKELEKIKRNIERSGLTQNKFFLKSVLDKEIIVVDGLKELIVEIKRVGTNLNQLTRLANQGKLEHAEELKNVNKEFEEIWQLLRQLIQKQA